MKPTRRVFALGALRSSGAALASCSRSTIGTRTARRLRRRAAPQRTLARAQPRFGAAARARDGREALRARSTDGGAHKALARNDLKVISVSNLHPGRV